VHNCSKFHSVYINRLLSLLAIRFVTSSKFHSVYINRIANCTCGGVVHFSKFHSAYINRAAQALFNDTFINSKFHSVYINSSSWWYLCQAQRSQNSILFILIVCSVRQLRPCACSQNSILFILIVQGNARRKRSYWNSKFHSVYINSQFPFGQHHLTEKLKIPFCLY